MENSGNNGAQNIRQESNVLGIVGFILALVSLFLSWLPFVGWTMWFLGFVFSLVGVFKMPRGLAVAGLIISLIGFILLLLFALFFAAALYPLFN